MYFYFPLLLQVRYTGFRDRPIEERRGRFRAGCCEGHTEISFATTGINVQLVFNPNHGLYHHPHHHHHHHPAHLGLEKECDFDKEHGKVGTSLIYMYVLDNEG